jgi:hypothetical protein
MALVRILYWKEFPAQIAAYGDGAKVKVMLPDRFQDAIEMAAMVEGSIGTQAYLEGWHWGQEHERTGAPHEVLEMVLSEVSAAHSEARLNALIMTRVAL